MQPDERTAARLWDMLTYAREIAETAAPMAFEAYVENADRRLATERRLEIIGEAARGVPEEFRSAHPEVPWRRIVALRNVLIHEYGEVKDARIFRIVQKDVPALIDALEPLVPPLPEEPPA